MSDIKEIRAHFFRGASVLVLTVSAAFAQAANFVLPAQPLSESLKAVAQQTGQNILFTPQAVTGLTAPELHGQMSGRDAVDFLLKGTNLQADAGGNGGLIIHLASGAQRDGNERPGTARPAPRPQARPPPRCK